ncbi:MAG: hypothetical protein IPG33_10565 [Betaproteobacteria bacterium]|nr:hypothetical protein [Betaproteobacteria bacterium]
MFLPLLPANLAVLQALTLPDFYAITHAGEISVAAQMEKLRRALAAENLRLVQIREPLQKVERRGAFAREERHGWRTPMAHAC